MAITPPTPSSLTRRATDSTLSVSPGREYSGTIMIWAMRSSMDKLSRRASAEAESLKRKAGRIGSGGSTTA